MLQSSDPYITITDASGVFGSVLVDSTKENTNDKFTVTVSPSCPPGYNIPARMIAIDGTFVDTFWFNLTVSFYNYLVYDPSPFPSSGQAINSILTSLGYIGRYTTSLLNEPTLAVYRTIFICCGIYPNNYRITAYGPEAMAIINYLNAGGRIYMEGGDVWYADPLVGGHNFCSRFGMQGFSDGDPDLGPVVGQSGKFTQDMYFNYNGDNQNMDHINPTTGYLIFADGNNGYYCGVAYNSGTYRTVGTSFQLGGLIDASAPSTKAILLDSIMCFLGLPVAGVEEYNQSINANKELGIHPNPFKIGDEVRIQYTPKTNAKVTVKIYNAVGNCVRTLINTNNQQSTTNNFFFWDGKNDHGLNISPGVYFINIHIDNKKAVKRIVLIN